MIVNNELLKNHYKFIDLNRFVFQLIVVVIIIDVLTDPPLAKGSLSRLDSKSS